MDPSDSHYKLLGCKALINEPLLITWSVNVVDVMLSLCGQIMYYVLHACA